MRWLISQCVKKKFAYQNFSVARKAGCVIDLSSYVPVSVIGHIIFNQNVLRKSGKIFDVNELYIQVVGLCESNPLVIL